MGAAVAVPIIASVAGGLASSSGSKKAGGQQPQLPGEIAPAVWSGSQLMQTLLRRGAKPYGGDFTAGLNPLQTSALQNASGLLGAGVNGYNDAFRTVNNAATMGINPADIDLARQQTQPLYEMLQGRGLQQLREGQALGGRLTTSGAAMAEGDWLRNMISQRQNDLLGQAMNMSQYRLSAAQSLPGMLAQGMGVAGSAYQMGEAARGVQQSDLAARYQDWLRTRPEAALPYLSSLYGAPFYTNPQSNALQGIGAGLSNLAGSPGFMSMIQQAFAPQPGQGTSSGYPYTYNVPGYGSNLM